MFDFCGHPLLSIYENISILVGFIFSAILSEKSLPKRGAKIAVGIHILVGIYNLSGFMHPFQPRILTRS